jgi:hypothetical protein
LLSKRGQEFTLVSQHKGKNSEMKLAQVESSNFCWSDKVGVIASEPYVPALFRGFNVLSPVTWA